MQSGVITLTPKGRDALKTTPPELSPLCRNILVQIDGKKSIEDLRNMFRGLKGLDDAVEKLFAGRFVELSRDCKNLVTGLAERMLGPKSPTLIRKIDELHAKYGEQCWEHLDELYKLARMFYGEVTADQLKTDILKILQDFKK